MPLTGYLKIPDIDGESQDIQEVLDRYKGQLIDEAEYLLRVLTHHTRDIDSFDLSILSPGGPPEHAAAGDPTPIFLKLDVTYVPLAEGKAGYQEALEYAARLDAFLDATGFDFDYKVKRNGDGTVEIKMTDVLVSSVSTGGDPDGGPAITDVGDFDFLL
ncbi:hypothetical protein P2H44_22070 [Albimonas sp. CAU 1670]|uniref:hypothetical protein n=1 Tax=Albimonas sp. CAU 1670 TaxID=3032599 RepID=UPI0023D99098|nr:hypothetical protein [Albimonas sp. CAU 1670]MDF2235254.1 hypothetical protein [Albimonas sp. CAU 1670]